MPTHESPQKKAVGKRPFAQTTNLLASRPFAAPTQPDPSLLSREVPRSENLLARISILNPNGAQSAPIQPKLTIGQPNDKYEQEADRVAKQVTEQLNTPQEEKMIQRQETTYSTKVQEHSIAISNHPSINVLQRQIANWRTHSLRTIDVNTVRHKCEWGAEAGQAHILDNPRTLIRERVTWGEGLPIADSYEYRNPGEHTGLARNPASRRSGADDHSIMPIGIVQPANIPIGQLVRFTQQQVYQVSVDNGTNWADIHGASYTINRTFRRGIDGSVVAKFWKTSDGGRDQACPATVFTFRF